jgi:signal transduction histidine kinase
MPQNCSEEEMFAIALRALHDARSPLRALQGAHEILHEHAVDEADVAMALKFADIAQLRLTHLVDGLAILIAETTRVHRAEPISLEGVCQHVWREVAATANSTALRCDITGSAEIRGDVDALPELMRQVLRNAVVFSGQAGTGRVTVCLSQTAEGAELVVTDPGPGIPTRFAEKVFEPMARLQAKSEIEGAGLGLTICRKIVARHGGRIHVDTQAKAGACLRIFLQNTPLAQA